MTLQTISPGRHHEATLPDLGENHYPGGQQNHAVDKPRSENCFPPALQKIMPATLSSNQLFTTVLSQQRFHFVQAIDGGPHLRLIIPAHCLNIRDLAPKIHFHLPLFLCDDSLNDGRRLL